MKYQGKEMFLPFFFLFTICDHIDMNLTDNWQCRLKTFSKKLYSSLMLKKKKLDNLSLFYSPLYYKFMAICKSSMN